MLQTIKSPSTQLMQFKNIMSELNVPLSPPMKLASRVYLGFLRMRADKCRIQVEEDVEITKWNYSKYSQWYSVP